MPSKLILLISPHAHVCDEYQACDRAHVPRRVRLILFREALSKL